MVFSSFVFVVQLTSLNIMRDNSSLSAAPVGRVEEDEGAVLEVLLQRKESRTAHDERTSSLLEVFSLDEEELSFEVVELLKNSLKFGRRWTK